MPKQAKIKKSALTPTVLIAGGAGFIGSYLSEKLLEKGARVVVLDNFDNGKTNFVEHLLGNDKFALFDVDINGGLPPEIESVDYIFHLASLETHLDDQVADLNTLLTNAIGTKNLLELAKKSEAKFLLGSSADIYKGQISPLDLARYFGETKEEEKAYELAEAKRFAEALVWEYYKNFDLDARIVRLPEVYGPKMDLEATGTLGRLLDELIKGNNLTIYGDGIEKEYYLYVEDAIAGLVKALFNANTKGKIYTLTENEPRTIIEIAFLLRNLASKEIDIKYTNETVTQKAETKIPDNSNLSGLRWKPKVPFKEGLKLTLESFGYTVNENSFKPAKLIEDKLKEQTEPVAAQGLTSLQNLKEPEPQKPANFFKQKGRSPTLKQVLAKIKLPKLEHKEKPVPKLTPKNKVAPALMGALILAFLLTFIGLPIVQTYVHTTKAIAILKKMPVTLAQLKSEEAGTIAEDAFQNFYKAKNAFRRLRPLFKLTGQKDEYNAAIRMLSAATYFSESMYLTSQALEPLSNIWEIIKPDTAEMLTKEQFAEAKLSLSKAQDAMQFAHAELKNVNFDNLPKALQPDAKAFAETLETNLGTFDKAKTAIMDIGELLGIQKPQNYLILLQNSNEIRPTGGFIGSYATLELDKGKIVNLEIDDIYNPDGQIDVRNIQVTAPSPITNYLEEDRLYIRNANWHPDFRESVKAITELFYKLDGSDFTGVLALDLKFVQEVLKVTGPIFLTAYNEEISAENLEEKAQFYSEFNYEEGVSQKKSFLSVLGAKLLEKLFSLPPEKMPLILDAMGTLLEEKHMLVHIPNNYLGVIIGEQGWDGRLMETKGDYLYVVNANLGGNKANYFVQNAMDYKVEALTRDGLLRATLVLTYTHQGQNTGWPGGTYKNYVRVLTQEGTLLTGAKLGETDIVKSVVIDTKNGYTIYGIELEIEPQETKQLTLYYDLPLNLSITSYNKDYSLYWQKQPGTQEDKISFTFVPPFGLDVAQGPKQFQEVFTTDKAINLVLR